MPLDIVHDAEAKKIHYSKPSSEQLRPPTPQEPQCNVTLCSNLEITSKSHIFNPHINQAAGTSSAAAAAGAPAPAAAAFCSLSGAVLRFNHSNTWGLSPNLGETASHTCQARSTSRTQSTKSTKSSTACQRCPRGHLACTLQPEVQGQRSSSDLNRLCCWPIDALATANGKQVGERVYSPCPFFSSMPFSRRSLNCIPVGAIA